ncbi:hypothetical protein LQE22_004302 [Klebsiella oxytoca]|nr:hypothetical protein [Klebsiella oxytoca]
MNPPLKAKQILFNINLIKDSEGWIAKIKKDLKNPRLRKRDERIEAISMHESQISQALFRLYQANKIKIIE